jgi:hypothetical protein
VRGKPAYPYGLSWVGREALGLFSFPFLPRLAYASPGIIVGTQDFVNYVCCGFAFLYCHPLTPKTLQFRWLLRMMECSKVATSTDVLSAVAESELCTEKGIYVGQ